MKKLFYLLPFVFAFACQQNTANQQAADETVAMNPIKDLFEEQIVVKMHLFGTQEEMPDAEMYPYTGKAIEGDALQYLGEGLQPGETGKVYACYHTENNDFYILRVPGKYVAGDLALAKWNPASNKLEKIQDLASIACDEGVCHQQDAWLTDLDDDRTLELVVHSRSTDENGNVTEENFTVLSQTADGKFEKSNEQMAALAVKDRYVLH